MADLKYAVLLLLLAFISFYTVSFGVWTWRKKNRLGAVMIFAVALTNLALPVYALLFRD